ncbi:hypothetical protein P7K49_010897 [Saguinus oedipus]|uniref:Uncharacterized protein n=1 Tax=Saguinus oedipus TaxID=9490 RepID=A0ABQ9VP44_SAGOE|nr:hypothetical protein P7K49_010897 [Saguinus oedipus]
MAHHLLCFTVYLEDDEAECLGYVMNGPQDGDGEEWKLEDVGDRMIPLDLLIGLQNQYWDDDQQNGHDDTQNQGPDVQALGGGGVGLGPVRSPTIFLSLDFTE